MEGKGHSPGMTSQKTRYTTDEVSGETPDKGPWPSWSREQPSLIRSSIKRGGQPSFRESSAGAARLSFQGLLAVRRLTQELKNRTSSRTQSWLQSDRHWPVSIIQEQVPLGAARLQVTFPWVRAQELMQAHLPCKLAGVAYQPALCAHLAAVLSAEIRDLTALPPVYVNPMLFCMALVHAIYLE
ncbi:hypothetical protein CapIbe_002344 [Capra ibex]